MPLAAPLAALAGIAGSLAVARGRFASGWALLLISVLLLRWPASLWSGEPSDRLSRRGRVLALVAVCAVAAFFRLYRIEQPGLWGDDALNGLMAFDILDGRIHSPFTIVPHSHSNFHALSAYPIAAAFRLFGADISTLRLPGALLGTACVPLLYGTIAPLFGSLTGLVAAFLYATSAPQLTHAKELVQIITGQFFQLAGLCLLVNGLTRRRPLLTAAAGVPLALCLYTYHSARLAPLTAGIYAAAIFWHERRAQPTRRRVIEHAAALGTFALMLIPAVYGWSRHPDFLVRRLDETSIWPVIRSQHSLWPLWENSWRTLSMFHYQQGPEYYWFGIATDPALNAIVAFLVVHGLVESLRRWREPRHLLLLVWCAVGLAPALLSTGAPRIYRAFLATPPLYVWAAMPIARLLTAPASRLGRTMAHAVAIALLAAVPLIDFNYYFYRLYTHPSFRWFQGERIVALARALRDLGPGWTGYLLADTFDASHETLRFLSRAWNIHITSVGSLADVLPLPAVPDRGAAYLMTHGTLDAAPAIERMYPGEPLTLIREPAPRTWWLDDLWSPPPDPLDANVAPTNVSDAVYAVPRAAAERPQRDPPWGLQVEYDTAGERLVHNEPYLFYAFLAPPFSRQFSATWRGRLRIPDPGGYGFVIRGNADVMTTVDGQPLTPQATLGAGEHDFKLVIRDVPPRFRLAVYWQPPGQEPALIPPAAFVPP